MLEQSPWKDYLSVQLKLQPGRARKKLLVHKLVALAFYGPAPANAPLCRHKDGNHHNNRADNLLYGTHRDNHDDAVRHGTAVCLRLGERHPKSKLSNTQYAEMLARAAGGESPTALAKEFNVHPTLIYAAFKGRGRKGVIVPSGDRP